MARSAPQMPSIVGPPWAAATSRLNSSADSARRVVTPVGRHVEPRQVHQWIDRRSPIAHQPACELLGRLQVVVVSLGAASLAAQFAQEVQGATRRDVGD